MEGSTMYARIHAGTRKKKKNHKRCKNKTRKSSIHKIFFIIQYEHHKGISYTTGIYI